MDEIASPQESGVKFDKYLVFFFAVTPGQNACIFTATITIGSFWI